MTENKTANKTGSKKKKAVDAFATHLPILEAIAKLVKLDTVLEFGSGKYSTPFFIEKSKKLISVEQQSYIYYEMTKRRFEDVPGVEFLYMYGTGKGPAWLKKQDEEYDLVFVDGDAKSRPLCINEAFQKTSLIVTHDTEELKMYEWHEIKLPEGWTRIDFQKLKPWTTVFTKDKELADKLIEISEDKGKES